MSEKPESKPPCPESEEELLAYIREMEAWPEGGSDMGESYGRCAYAVAYASVATFNYLAGKLGITGFQASCADMLILSLTRGMEHGFMVLNADNLLYPQYDLPRQVHEWITDTRARLAPVARAKLDEDGGFAHPDVVARWEEIAAIAWPGEDS
jgi:hypothetical protein